MRKTLFFGLGAAAILAIAAIEASANPSCMSADSLCVDTEDSSAGTGNPLEPVTSQLPVQGVVAVGTTSTLIPSDYWVFVDGDEGSPDPLDGYIGFAGPDLPRAVLGLVANSSGDFQRGGGNQPLLGPPTTLPSPPGVGMPPLNGLPVGPSDTPVPLPDLSQMPSQVAELVGMLPSAPTAPDLGMGPVVVPGALLLIP